MKLLAETRGQKELEKQIFDYEVKMRRASTDIVEKSALKGEKKAIRLAPLGKTGDLKKSVKAQVDFKGKDLVFYWLGSALRYAMFTEFTFKIKDTYVHRDPWLFPTFKTEKRWIKKKVKELQQMTIKAIAGKAKLDFSLRRKTRLKK